MTEMISNFETPPDSSPLAQFLKQHHGPLPDLVSSLPEDQIEKVDRLILNPNGLAPNIMKYVSPEKAPEIFKKIKTLLSMEESRVEERRKLASQIAAEIESTD